MDRGFMKKLPFYLTTVFLLTLIAMMLLPPSTHRHEPGISRIKAEMSNIKIALQQYEATYNEFPRGENSAISQALLGANAKSRVFIQARTNNLGELIDPWNKPYNIKIQIGDRTGFTIRSAGENQTFDDSDDYLLDSAKNNFTQGPKP
jgi:hypothetical protein